MSQLLKILSWPAQTPLRFMLVIGFLAVWPHLIYSLNDHVIAAQTEQAQ